MTSYDPFSDPNLTFNGKTLEERAKELDKEEKARKREERKAELLAKRTAREAEENGKEPTPEAEPKASITQPVIIPPITPTQGFKIDDLADRYRIHNVEHQGELYVVDWSKELLDNKQSHTQKEWIDLTINLDWKLAPAPFYNSTITSLFNNQNHSDPAQKALVETVRQMFKEDFKQYWMMTSTRAKYKAKGKDNVTHGWGYANPKKLSAKLVGPDEYLKPGCNSEETIKAVFGTDDMAMVEQAYEWIGKQGKKPYIWRINSTPKKDTERAVVLGLGVNWFNINIYDGIYYVRPARGWSATRAKTP